jgi:predicted CoA-binding protein
LLQDQYLQPKGNAPHHRLLRFFCRFSFFYSFSYNAGVTTSEKDAITELLKRAKTIAVVGLSDSPLRPSHGVAAYMQSHGYRIIPVNPSIKGALGEKAVSSLAEIPEKIDIVDVFRRSEAVPEVVDEAIKAGASAIWMQEGVVHEEAAAKARKAGLFVVMDRCILKEHRRRIG